MLASIKNIVKQGQIKKHAERLFTSARIGKEFCASPMYPNRLGQLYANVKIINKAKEASAIKIGDYCNASVSIVLQEQGRIKIGDYVYMNSGCVLQISNQLIIGSNCMFGPNVKIWDSDNHPLDSKERLEQTMKIPFQKSLFAFSGGGDVHIDNNVWIGMDVLILGGVHIGEGAVIAARSVVTKSVEPYTLVAGVPAKFIKKLN